MTTLREVFEAPFVLRSETVRQQDGTWIRSVSYPELDCAVEGADYLEILDELEIARVRTLAYRIEFGAWNVRFRDALPGGALHSLLGRAGLEEWIEHLDEEVGQVHGTIKVGERLPACT